jgi:hypothetical protein
MLDVAQQKMISAGMQQNITLMTMDVSDMETDLQGRSKSK